MHKNKILLLLFLVGFIKLYITYSLQDVSDFFMIKFEVTGFFANFANGISIEKPMYHTVKHKNEMALDVIFNDLALMCITPDEHQIARCCQRLIVRLPKFTIEELRASSFARVMLEESFDFRDIDHAIRLFDEAFIAAKLPYNIGIDELIDNYGGCFATLFNDLYENTIEDALIEFIDNCNVKYIKLFTTDLTPPMHGRNLVRIADMAEHRDDYVEKCTDRFDQFFENLAKICIFQGKCNTVNHWLSELRAHIIPLLKKEVKNDNKAQDRKRKAFIEGFIIETLGHNYDCYESEAEEVFTNAIDSEKSLIRELSLSLDIKDITMMHKDRIIELFEGLKNISLPNFQNDLEILIDNFLNY